MVTAFLCGGIAYLLYRYVLRPTGEHHRQAWIDHEIDRIMAERREHDRAMHTTPATLQQRGQKCACGKYVGGPPDWSMFDKS